LIPVVGLLLLAAIVYAPVARFGFLNWDDSWYIQWNDLIRSWHPVNLYRIATEPVARNYAPLTIGTFLVEYTFWRVWPGGYHLTNLLLHMLNGVLVWQLLKQLTRNDWLAWLAAALFVVHPVQVESVAWVSSRKTLLSATFMLASFLCWLRPDRTSRQECWGCGWLLLGLLSKASAVVVPPIVIAYDVLIRRKKLSESVPRQVLPMFCCVMLILTTMNAQTSIVGGIRSHIGMSKLHLLAIDATLLWRYVGMLFWPHDLCVLYDPPVHGITGTIVLAIMAWLALGWGLWKLRNEVPLLTLAGLSWLLLLLPVLNLFPITTLMNDRYLYLPCVPVFAALGAIVQFAWSRACRWRPQIHCIESRLFMALTALLIGIAGWQTLTYLPVWREPLTLWSHARVHAPSLTVVQIQWAITLEDQGRFAEASNALNYALEHCHPDELDIQRIEKMLRQLDSRAEETGSPG
jgi:hypothetical protein